jgi:hypothetical protein
MSRVRVAAFLRSRNEILGAVTAMFAPSLVMTTRAYSPSPGGHDTEIRLPSVTVAIAGASVRLGT